MNTQKKSVTRWWAPCFFVTVFLWATCLAGCETDPQPQPTSPEQPVLIANGLASTTTGPEMMIASGEPWTNYSSPMVAV